MHLLCLPGVGGDPAFWQPLGALLPAAWRKTYIGYPGLGTQPPDPAVNSFDDLLARAEAALDAPSAILAQSMGGILAVRLALKHPERVTHLVLTATSGGVDMARFGAADWRPAYRAEFPQAPAWITAFRPDHTAALSQIAAPALLLWGDSDPISPVAVGRHLQALLPNARLQVLPGGDHMFARDRAAEIAPLVRVHLER